MHNAIGVLAAGLATSAISAYAADGLRVAAWNITNYNGGFQTQLGLVVHGEFMGNAMDPDVILLQEISGQSALNTLAGALNSAPNSPGDWVAAPIFDNGSINTALVYREGKLDLLASTLVSPGSPSPNHPRNVVRYDVRLEGYAGNEATLALYPTHMKAGSGSSDIARRQEEVDEIIADLVNLPAGSSYILGGDFNTQRSTQSHFVDLVGSPYNTGPFIDPINTPGSWQNNSTFRNVHTQDPATQVDDRYDIILISPSMDDGSGLEYIGDPSLAWNLSTPLDPNHSYRVWGNDGTTYNTVLATATNSIVGPAIAQAIIQLAGNTGHIPLYLDVQVPAVATVDQTTLDLGDVAFGGVAQGTLGVGSAGNTALWGTGIEDTEYSFAPGAGVGAPAGTFTDAAGGALNQHTIALTDTAVIGPISGTLTINTNDSETPQIIVNVIANVVGCSAADLNGDGALNNTDINLYVNAFLAMEASADLNGDGFWNNTDINLYINSFLAGCD